MKERKEKMDKLIALALSLLLLCPFPIQYSLQMKNNHNISRLQAMVNGAKEEARQLGYFSPELMVQMRGDIAKEFDITENEIMINVTTDPKYRLNSFDEREMISYEIGVPIKKIVAAHRFWGISDDDNKTIYYIKGKIGSERLGNL